MHLAVTEKFLGRLLGFAGAFTTIFIVSGSVTDPVNTPKFVAIGSFGIAAIAVVLFTPLRSFFVSHKLELTLLLLFALSMLLSSFASKAPTTQLLYGVYGRNNGLLTYIFLGAIFASALTLRNPDHFKFIVYSFLTAGCVNLIYCLWVLVFGDFIGWNNPYGNILGTLGNPNFIGAFLGMIFSAIIALAVSKEASGKVRIFTAITLFLCGFEIIKSHAIQGRVVAALGTSFVLFIFIRSKFHSGFLAIYSGIVLVAGSLAALGALQIGPLSDLIYKTSVSLRGQYWLAGWNTGNQHPFTGVGMDTFGDWYRRMRDAHALEMPGVNTVVNAAHNVPLDMFSFGGWPLFLAYLLIIGYTAFALLKLVIRNKEYDFILAVIGSAWLGYQIQSIISINQIGLAVWGWLLSGLILAYEVGTRPEKSSSSHDAGNKKRPSVRNGVSPKVTLIALLGGIIGGLIALPPLTSDIKWRSAQLAQSLPLLEESMKSSYFNPPNTTKYLTNIGVLESSKYSAIAHKYALEAVKWNPDVYEQWRALYLISGSSQQEKELAVTNMKRLDPLNPDVTAIK